MHRLVRISKKKIVCNVADEEIGLCLKQERVRRMRRSGLEQGKAEF